MKVKNPLRFYLGIILGFFLLISYFINFEIDSGSNYIVKDSLLGILIFHNFFIFAFYVFIALGLIISSLLKFKIK